MNGNEREQQIVAAEQAANDNPANFEAHINLGMAYFNADRLDEAMAAFDQAIALNPEAAAAYNGVGRVRYHTGPPEKAIEAYTKAFTLDPHYVDAYFGLGILHSAQTGDFESAVKAFQLGLKHNPSEPFLTASLGNSYARMDQIDKAMACLEQAITLDPKSTYALGNLSILHLHHHRFEDMIHTCLREIEIDDDHSARRMLGYVYDRQGRYDEAIAELERAIVLEPNDYEARGALSKVYRAAGYVAEADEQYAIAKEMAEQDDEYGQACFAAVSGQIEEALTLLETALAEGQVQRGWIRIDPEFAFLQDDPRFQALLKEPVQPQTWHYGIMAQHWAEFENDSLDAPDIDYYRTAIEENGGPALDVACGTGRLLLNYLREGLEVDGCDISADMLAHCQEKAAKEGFAPTLAVQAMHELDMPRTYRTIYVCGSFGLGSTRQQDAEALRRFYEHLAPGGLLLLDQQMPYGGGMSWCWKDWIRENREKLDPNFWTPPDTDRTADGREFVLRSRLADIDPLEQIVIRQIRAELWQNGQRIGTEEHTLTSNVYFKNELVMMLKQAGFDEVAVQGDFKEEEATPEHDALVFIARKQA